MSKAINKPNANKSNRTNNQDWNYEITVAEIETIIEQIEAGELPLADVFEKYAAAVKYLNQCDVFLQERQQQMDLLIETLTDDSEF